MAADASPDQVLLRYHERPMCRYHDRGSRSGWTSGLGPWHNREYAQWSQRALEDFARETGIAVKRFPAPESSDEQLVLERQLLEGGAPTPDVYIIDAIWPGILAEHLLDLRPRLGAEAARHFPALVANNVVQ